MAKSTAKAQRTCGKNMNKNSQQSPEPDPALKRLNILVGTWNIKGHTLDSKDNNVSARTTFEWLPGGFFLKQNFEADFVGMKIQSLEIIGYDPISDTFPSTVIPVCLENLFPIDIILKTKT
jgi:hypothetical protein